MSLSKQLMHWYWQPNHKKTKHYIRPKHRKKTEKTAQATPWFGTPFTASSQDTEKALFSQLRVLSYKLFSITELKICHLYKTVSSYNKSAQSNLGRGPGRDTVAHVCRKVPIGYNGAPQIRPQKYPFPCTDPQTPLPASSLDLSDLWCQMASRSDRPFFHNALDRPTYSPTDRSSMGKFDDYRPLRYENDAA